MIDKETFKIMREARGYNLTQLANEVGISVQYIYDMEKGRRTLKRNPELIKRIAAVLECPVKMICVVKIVD